MQNGNNGKTTTSVYLLKQKTETANFPLFSSNGKRSANDKRLLTFAVSANVPLYVFCRDAHSLNLSITTINMRKLTPKVLRDFSSRASSQFFPVLWCFALKFEVLAFL
jgi:hypothetical protein